MKTSDLEDCVLCCREITIYAIGACDHAVCFECSARMRVLCETNECPICRSDMPVVVLTLQKKPFSEISRKYFITDKKYEIIFESKDVQKAFLLLLENKCKVCGALFPDFNKLRDHVRREHGLQYCELCAENLKIFPFERKTYNRKDLARHKRVGDPDETSHRGHPICEFCDQRYVDNDELFRHLRREHYYCHFCDADGKHQYYEDYDYLRAHFRKEHFLCEEGECANDRFVGAFRTDIDLKAHIAVHHNKNKSKAEAKQARLLEFEFSYAPHPSRPNANSSPRGHRFSQHRRQNAEERNSRENKASQPPEKEKIDTQSTLEFPYLCEDAESNGAPSSSNLSSMTLQSFSRNSVPPPRPKNVMSSEDFPALITTSVSVTSEMSNNQSRKFNFSIQQNNSQARAPNVSVQVSQKSVPKSIESKTREADDKKSKSWGAKKNFTFDDEFPKLETKKAPVTSRNVANTTVNTVERKSQPSVEIVSTSQSNGGDQFIIIKSKARKKKHNKTANEDTEDSDIKDSLSNTTSSFSSLTLSNNNFNLLDQDISEDKYRKNLYQPNNFNKNYIEEDTWKTKVSFGKDDFPPLAPVEPAKKPPGLSGWNKKAPTPPPGFNVNSNSSGPLNITLSSIARQIAVPNQNKTNEAIIPHSEATYKKPHNFSNRNDNLACKIRELGVFDEFKTLSFKFRQEEINAASYYSKCLEILGEKDFLGIFPELISLLPDINKQQELLSVHKKHQINSGAIPKQKLLNSKISVCDLCYQVLTETDYQYHISEHAVEFSK